MNRLRRLIHRHRWAALTVRCGYVTVTVRACWCGARHKNTSKGE